ITKHCEHSPAWRPGVSDDEIAAAEEAIGRPLPDDYKAFLRLHDGQEEAHGVSILTGGGRLAPLEQVVSQHADSSEWADDSGYDYLDDEDRIRGIVFDDRRIAIGGSIWMDGDNTV